MRNKKWLFLAGLLLVFAGCTDDLTQHQFSFNATVEPLQNTDNNGSKVQLLNEQWTAWEIYDSISLVSNASTVTGGKCDLYTGWLVDGGLSTNSDYDGVFISTLTERDNETSQWFVAIHPAGYDKHQITYTGSTNHGFSAKVFLNSVQNYRHDSSYARQLLPMVATYDGPEYVPGTTDPYRLDFHSLAGIVRLQLVNGTGSDQNISKIELESITPTGSDTISRKPLCGLFPVKNLYRFNAHLDAANVTSPGYTLTLSTAASGATGSLPFAANDIKSFYIVLPAFHGMDTTTFFHLRMTVHTTDHKKCSKSFTVRTRRNGITYLRAIDITNFNASTGEGTPGLVGNGTSTRPFKIYTYDDLRYVQYCFSHPVGTTVYINGQAVTANTHFRIMRSDIELDPDTWTEGIKNFVGTMSYIANGTTEHTPGITNNTNVPLFHNINSDGKVTGLTIRSGSSEAIQYTNNNGSFSPLCNMNQGIIENCNFTSLPGTTVIFQNRVNDSTCFAGICAINDGGLIQGCGCTAKGTYSATGGVNSRVMFAGICYRNLGTIKDCYAASGLSVEGNVSLAAGICFDNKSYIMDCYYAARINVNPTAITSWGAIAYRNTSPWSYIDHCYSSDNSMLTSTGNSVMGGIVCEHRDGTVNYCWSEAQMRGVKVGGIATTVSGGTLQNCFINDSLFLITLNANSSTHYAGGLAAEMTSGSINNCFSLIHSVTRYDANGIYGTVVGNLAGGTVDNCYGLEVTSSNTPFYGTNTGGTLNHCYVVKGSQTGVTGINTVNATTLENLKDNLNSNIPMGGQYWTRGSGNHAAPYIVNPYSKGKKR